MTAEVKSKYYREELKPAYLETLVKELTLHYQNQLLTKKSILH